MSGVLQLKVLYQIFNIKNQVNKLKPMVKGKYRLEI